MPGQEAGAAARSEADSRESPLRVLLLDDDPLFREALATNLADERIEVSDFADGRALLAFLDSHDWHDYDALLLDLRMPVMSGIEALHALRGAGIRMPVVFLTTYSEEVYEQAALEGGAVDFVDKSRSLAILVARLKIIAQGAKAPSGSEAPSDTLRVGGLFLNVRSARADWHEQPVPLTVTQFRIVHLLAARAGEDVSYRQIYDVVHGEGFAAGEGEDGYRVNVRSLIKRIRQAFRELDPNFDKIRNYPAFGYRWKPPAEPAADSIGHRPDATA
jgi:two-component system, OmpR family, response regulator ChvI